MRESSPPAEPATFEDLYAEHAERVLSLLWRFGVAASEREDVSQEVWIDVHRSLPLFSSSTGSARAWITGIARNSALDWKRKRQRRPELWTHTDQEPIGSRTGETEMEEAERRAALWSYFERAIPREDQREAWMLHEVDGLTIEEVAQITSARLCTVKWRIRMARSRLKKQLTEEERRTLAAILPVLSVDAFARALRETKFSDDVSARVWDRVKERIEAEGGSIHDQLGTPATAPGPAAPKGYTFTGPGLAGTLGGVFVAGAFAGAVAHALLSWPNKTSMTAVDAEIRPPPVQTAEPSQPHRLDGTTDPAQRASCRSQRREHRRSRGAQPRSPALERALRHDRRCGSRRVRSFRPWRGRLHRRLDRLPAPPQAPRHKRRDDLHHRAARLPIGAPKARHVRALGRVAHEQPRPLVVDVHRAAAALTRRGPVAARAQPPLVGRQIGDVLRDPRPPFWGWTRTDGTGRLLPAEEGIDRRSRGPPVLTT